jgi:fatty-acyl-CoA synthase/benzoate-CoA ligase/fatty acid CoA ligase FadD22
LRVFARRGAAVVAGALVSADGTSWVPVLDGVVDLSQAHRGPPPTAAGELPDDAPARPFHAGHRDWQGAADRSLARIPFLAAADRLRGEAALLARRHAPETVVLIAGDDSGWAAALLAALLPDRAVVAHVAAGGALGVAGCRLWLSAADAPANLTMVVGGDAAASPVAADAGVDLIDMAAIALDGDSAGAATVALGPPRDEDPSALHALIDPDAPVDLNRARIGGRILSDDETRVLYWAGRAASAARTAERLGLPADRVVAILAALHGEGVVRLERLPAAMARLHVFWSSGEVLPAMAQQTLGALASFGFRAFAQRTFLRDSEDGSTISFGEARRVICRTAAALRRDGVGAGDRVAAHALPHIELAMIFWACVHLGAVFVPIGSMWSREMADRVLGRCRPRLLFINEAVGARVPEDWRARAIRLDVAAGGGRGAAAAPDCPSFTGWLDAGGTPPAAPAAHSGPDDTALIVLTSGSTGTPKMVARSNAGIVNFCWAMARAMGICQDDIFFSVTEFIAVPGLVDTVVTPLLSGSSAVVADRRRRGGVLGQADICRSERVTVFRTVPAALRRLCQAADRLEPANFASLRLMVSSSAPLYRDTLDRLDRLCPAPILDAAGTTEAGGALLFSDGSLRRGSIFATGGRPTGIVLQVVDDTGGVIRDGTVGCMRVHGDQMMSGYVDETGRTCEVFSDGWLLTGDMARWEPDDLLRIAGRAVEMIKSAWGDKVFPSEIEAVLMADERVFEVAACGFTDTDGTERIAAFVIPGINPDDPDRLGEELKSRVRQALGDSKVPHAVVLVEDLPRAARDKVDKPELMRRFLARR